MSITLDEAKALIKFAATKSDEYEPDEDAEDDDEDYSEYLSSEDYYAALDSVDEPFWNRKTEEELRVDQADYEARQAQYRIVFPKSRFSDRDPDPNYYLKYIPLIGTWSAPSLNGTVLGKEDEFGGEGEGDSYWAVFSTTDSTGTKQYWRIDGYYASYDGGYYDGDLYEVEPFEKTVRDWKKA